MLRLAAFAFLFVSIAHGQDQEQKLLDRLLRPNTTLQNEAQGKQFTAGGATTTKSYSTRSFFVRQRKQDKGFWNTRQVSTNEFHTQTSHDALREARLATRTRIAKADVPYSTPAYRDVRESSDANRVVQTSAYSDARPFLGRGKSQKALSAQNHEMTVDEVRELLNKNK